MRIINAFSELEDCNSDFFFFFFQAEDGIRDIGVTGVQTCALPISSGSPGGSRTGYAISGNGQFVVFASDATNLVPGVVDDNNLPDYFVRDLVNNKIGRASCRERV